MAEYGSASPVLVSAYAVTTLVQRSVAYSLATGTGIEVGVALGVAVAVAVAVAVEAAVAVAVTVAVAVAVAVAVGEKDAVAVGEKVLVGDGTNRLVLQLGHGSHAQITAIAMTAIKSRAPRAKTSDKIDLCPSVGHQSLELPDRFRGQSGQTLVFAVMYPHAGCRAFPLRPARARRRERARLTKWSGD